MAHYWVQMPDLDPDKVWSAISSHSAESAAEEYAEQKDNNSGGEMFLSEDDCRTILVKERGSDEVFEFVVGAHYSKSYMASAPLKSQK